MNKILFGRFNGFKEPKEAEQPAKPVLTIPFKVLTDEEVNMITALNDATTKDGCILSPKQQRCIMHHFDEDESTTLSFIKSHTYDEVSDSIGTFLAEWEKKQEEYQEEDYQDV